MKNCPKLVVISKYHKKVDQHWMLLISLINTTDTTKIAHEITFKYILWQTFLLWFPYSKKIVKGKDILRLLFNLTTVEMKLLTKYFLFHFHCEVRAQMSCSVSF